MIVAGWNLRPLNSWRTVDGRLMIVHWGGRQDWAINASTKKDIETLESSGLVDASFSGPRAAALAAHEVLGTSTSITRGSGRYAVGKSGCVAQRVRFRSYKWDLMANSTLMLPPPLQQELSGKQFPTLKAAIEYFDTATSAYGYTAERDSQHKIVSAKLMKPNH